MNFYQKYFTSCFNPRRILSRTRLGSTDSKTLTKEEQEKYDNSMMVMWDNYAVFKHAVEKEAKKKSKEIALKLLARNTPLDDIADLTDLSIEEIKKLEQ